MPLIIFFSVLCQIICGMHVIKTGQDRYWLYLIIIFPFLGCLIYALAILLPSLLNSYRGRLVVKELQDKVAPTRNLKALRDQLALSDNTENQTVLADELARLKHYDEAITHYKAALSGIHHDNPEILLKLAFAEFYTQAYLACQNTLDFLIAQNPKFCSSEGHLLYARALKGANNLAKAEEEYKVLIEYYPGPDARFYYAQLLQSQNRLFEAKEQLSHILNYVKLAPKYYKTRHKHCLTETKKLFKILNENQS